MGYSRGKSFWWAGCGGPNSFMQEHYSMYKLIKQSKHTIKMEDVLSFFPLWNKGMEKENMSFWIFIFFKSALFLGKPPGPIKQHQVMNIYRHKNLFHCESKSDCWAWVTSAIFFCFWSFPLGCKFNHTGENVFSWNDLQWSVCWGMFWWVFFMAQLQRNVVFFPDTRICLFIYIHLTRRIIHV